MDVRTIDVDRDTLATRKEVQTLSVEFETPRKALQVGKLRGSETVSPIARGIAEIYTTADAATLSNSRNGSSVLANKLGPQSRGANDNEFVVPFLQYDDTATLTSENASEIAKLETNYGDVITVPLMTPLVNAAENGADRDSEHVSATIENTRTFLDAIEELGIGKPVMGVIPPISEDCTMALIELYHERGVEGYCVDFNRRSPMAQFQLDEVINPLMGTLTAYDSLDSCLTYAINTRNSRPGVDGSRTPDRMYSYTIGFDIVGDNHISPNFPEEVFERIAEENKNSEVTLRLFDGESMSVREIPVSGLDTFLPDEAEISVERVRNRIARNPNAKYRLRNLVNAELISIYLESEDGVDPEEILTALQSGASAEDRDLQRIADLVADVRDRD